MTEPQSKTVTNVLCVGIGGQGVLTVSEVLAQAAYYAGYDVKKSEVHGMSQRGGSVTSAIRFGPRVDAPLIPEGEVDLLIGFEPNETKRSLHLLREGGTVVEAGPKIEAVVTHPRTFNIAVLGAASKHLKIDELHWTRAIAACVPEGTAEVNSSAFSRARALDD